MDDYYEGVVMQYLRADPSMFVRPQSCIQLNIGHLKDGEHWYCDIVAARLRKPETVFLCEVTFAKRPTALFKRLLAWDAHWPEVRAALAGDNGMPESWAVQPWVFVRGERLAYVRHKLAELFGPREAIGRMPQPLASSLDDVTPWNYTAPLQLPPRGLEPDASR